MKIGAKLALAVTPVVAYVVGAYVFLRTETHTNTVTYHHTPEKITKPLPALKGQKCIRVLSLQGGGMLGLVELAALEWLEERTGKPIAELFDVVAGSSTGSIIGAGLLTPDEHGRPKYRAADLRKIYIAGSAKIFARSIWRMLFTAGGLLGAQYSAEPKRHYLEAVYEETRFQDLLRPMLVPVFDVLNNQPIIHLNWQSDWEPTLNHRVADLINGATATPVLFPPLCLANAAGKLQSIFADGGAFLNNPALTATLVTSLFYPEHELMIVSLGIDNIRQPTNLKLLRAGGILGWGPRYLAEVLINGSTKWRKEVLDEAIRMRCWDRDTVFDVYAQVPSAVHTDLLAAHDPKSLEIIHKIGETMVKDNLDKLERLAQQLVQP